MKLTKDWKPLLGIYLIVSGLIGIILYMASDEGSWFFIGLLIGIAIWFVHQTTVQKEPERRKKKK